MKRKDLFFRSGIERDLIKTMGRMEGGENFVNVTM
jgi:hypothetical protein